MALFENKLQGIDLVGAMNAMLNKKKLSQDQKMQELGVLANLASQYAQMKNAAKESAANRDLQQQALDFEREKWEWPITVARKAYESRGVPSGPYAPSFWSTISAFSQGRELQGGGGGSGNLMATSNAQKQADLMENAAFQNKRAEADASMSNMAQGGGQAPSSDPRQQQLMDAFNFIQQRWDAIQQAYGNDQAQQPSTPPPVSEADGWGSALGI